ncbi:hypothetical protein EZJ28_14185 [Gramella sp. KN1008]|nr:S41 family peptidase [Gramella sp. KN1008]TBW26547.1 hypothetical protein EZJ28_14185 [Gramella sp. KN1008]
MKNSYHKKSLERKLRIAILGSLIFSGFLFPNSPSHQKTIDMEKSYSREVESSGVQDLTEEQIKQITNAIPELILKHYVFEEKGIKIAKEFKKLLNSKKYLKIHSPDSLAVVLSRDLEQISNDGHMYVKRKKLKKHSGSSGKSWEELEKEAEIKNNYGFESVRILNDSTGYIKITEFMHPKRTMPTAVAAMKLVENSENLILDLRNNGGGYPGIMMYILNHYFDGSPTHLSTTYFANKDNVPYTQYTSDLVYGKLRKGTPLYLIVNKKTGSAAEYFHIPHKHLVLLK